MNDNQEQIVDKDLIPEQGIKIQNIVIRPVVRQSQDIEKWRQYLKYAEAINGRRVPLYDLYDEVMLDGVLSDLVEKRIIGVTKNKLQFVGKDGKEVDAMNELLRTDVFRQLRKEVQLAKHWGITVVELGLDNNGLMAYSVPRKHILPKEGRIVLEQYGYDGYDYRKPPYSKYVFEVGKYDDLGLILKAAPYVIYKRGGFGDWAQFAEVFGMPFREARYDGYNDVVRQQLVQALQAAGGAGFAVLPRDAELTIHENKNNQANGQLFDDLRRACNEELAILILGQTETTTKTAGKMGGNDDTHEQTEDDINLSDREDELCIFNEKVKPILKTLGFPVDGGQFQHKQEEEKLTTQDQINVIDIMKNKLKVPVGDDYIYQVTGVPKPDDYDDQKGKMDAAALAMQNSLNNNNNDDNPDDPAAKKPPTKKPNPAAQKKLMADIMQLMQNDEFKGMMAGFFEPAP